MQDLEADPKPRSRASPNEPELTGLPTRYRIRRLIGEGAQKRVYLAQDDSLDRPVAIATIPVEGLSQTRRERLLEARSMARIGEHPHVVTVYDVIETPRAFYLVTQYLPGGDLEGELAESGGRPLPLRRSLRVGMQVCRALEVAHERGITHHDVKPGNVFLSERGDCLLGDFGMASERTGEEARGGDYLFGTPDYMAPELIAGEPAAPASDLYALGCLLHELITGAPPFRHDDPNETLRRHQHSPPRRTSETNPGVPTTLDDLVQALLSKRPSERPARARDVRAALEGILFAGSASSGDASSGATDELARGLDAAATRPVHALVGREAELARLVRGIERAVAGRPSASIVRGEAGAGKSTLIAAARTAIARCGAVALTGVAEEHTSTPYRPIIEALLPVLGNLTALAEEDADAIRNMLFHGELADDPDPYSSDEAQRFRFLSGMSRALVTLSRRRPIVLILDDVHWMDSASLQLIRFVLDDLSKVSGETPVRVGLILCLRPDEDRGESTRAMQELVSLGRCEVIDLAPLRESGVQQMMQGLGIPRPSEQLVHDLTEATAGNPLFVEELVHHLAQRGELQNRGGFTVSLQPLSDGTLLTSAASAMRTRLDDLSGACRALLVGAAFLGLRIPLRRLAALEEEPAESLLDRLDEAVDKGILIDDGQVYRFRHPALREALQRVPNLTRRQRIHGRVARCLAAETPEAELEPILEIAHHLILAGPAADVNELLEYAVSGADLALARFAWREAAQLLSAAVRIESESPRLGLSRRADLHRKLGRAYYHLGDSGPCIHHLDLAIEGFRGAGELTGLGLALLDRSLATDVFGLIRFGDLGDLEPIRQVLDGLGQREPRLRARLLFALAERNWTAQQAGEARRLCADGMALAKETGDHEIGAIISRMVGHVEWQQLDLEASLSALQSAAGLFRRANSALEEDRDRARIPLVLAMSGKLSRAYEAASDVIGVDHSDATLAAAARTMIDSMRGRREETESAAEAVLESLRRSRHFFAATLVLPALAYSRSMGNDAAAAHRAYDMMLEPGLAFDDPSAIEPITQTYRQLIDLHATGRAEPASIELPAFDAPETQISLFNLAPLCAQIELAEAVGYRAIPPSLRDAMAIADRRGVVFTVGWCFLLQRMRAVAAELDGDVEEASALYARAIQLGVASGAVIETARARLGWASLMASTADSLEEATKQAEIAAHALTEHGPRHLADRAEKLASWLGERV